MSSIKLPNGMELVFAPGCFDNFEGTQEELDSLVKEITDKFASGEVLTEATPLDLDFDDVIDNLSPEEIQELLGELDDFSPTKRTLQ